MHADPIAAAGGSPEAVALRCCVDLPATPCASALARRAARTALHGWGVADVAVHDAVELVVAELVANAVRHTGAAGRGPQLHLEAPTGDGDGLLVAVADHCTRPPVGRRAGANAESGRGLAIVTALAGRWGVEDWGAGKRVWVHLPCSPLPDRPAGPAAPAAPRDAAGRSAARSPLLAAG